ncbi:MULTISPECIES: YqgE/AlgH family protein [unclassified Hahella]|uniref:YqgE/AlgH family protein n=1 Tax=unclassified Hahella TaxID=2624107 RepID=UPI000FDD2355|nr:MULTISPECIES: YqgE/AlgH family protein [unclassified Hahella]AZZ90072.1 YqgE/AlgH family protein [Hahella sp. KA22]MDG9668753.1 YqgE/AlgH family protein [Hahella sp. CR1]QAY53442.1 YqgE/AlgH family protein [Hahella sp. KA22]
MSSSMSTLRNQFLIAMPHLKDPNFEGTISYICDHNDEGAMGIVINRPLDIRLSDMLAQLELGGEGIAMPVYSGGPVQIERGFVLHSPLGDWQSSIEIAPDICITTSKDILEAMARGVGPDRTLVALGYAGWGAGQLEKEISNNFWITCPADSAIIFRTPDSDKVVSALGRVGIDYHRLSSISGHA